MTDIVMIAFVGGGLVLSIVLSIRKWRALRDRDD